MIQLSTHQNFYKHTSTLANELVAIESFAKNKEQQLFTGIDRLGAAVRAVSAVKQPKAVEALVASYFVEVSKVLEVWQGKVANYDAGLTFREQFGDSLLVFVYGKVKAGKSSLGNFVASGRGKPDEAWLAQLGDKLHSPEFFLADKNQSFAEAINFKQGFQVGDVETTSCIQGFRVPGMTWVDSPGLHSVNSENGDLAQKYVDSADLIIYPMNTAQPGRKSDLQELEHLLKAGKRVLVLITRCDELDEDEDEAGNLVTTRIMKSAQNRHDQETYVQQKLDELCAELGISDADTSVLTVSVEYAECHNNSSEAMQDSGMQALFDKLQSILSSEGIELKKQVPMSNLQYFYKQLLSHEGTLSLVNLREPLSQAQSKLNELKVELQQIKEQAKSRIALDFASGMDQLVEEHAQSRDMPELAKKLQTLIQHALVEHYQQPMQQFYQQAIGAFSGATAHMGLCMGLEFENKQTEIIVDISRKSAAVGSGAGAVLGGIAGFFVAGPVGVMIGSTLGGAAGGAAGSVFNSKETKIITVGDNREEIKTVLLKKGLDRVDEFISDLHRKTNNEFLLPLQKAVEQVLQQTGEFQHYLEEQYHV